VRDVWQQVKIPLDQGVAEQVIRDYYGQSALDMLNGLFDTPNSDEQQAIIDEMCDEIIDDLVNNLEFAASLEGNLMAYKFTFDEPCLVNAPGLENTSWGNSWSVWGETNKSLYRKTWNYTGGDIQLFVPHFNDDGSLSGVYKLGIPGDSQYTPEPKMGSGISHINTQGNPIAPGDWGVENIFEPGSTLVLYEDKSGVGVGWFAKGYYDGAEGSGQIRDWWAFWKWYMKNRLHQ